MDSEYIYILPYIISILILINKKVEHFNKFPDMILDSFKIFFIFDRNFTGIRALSTKFDRCPPPRFSKFIGG